MVNLRPCLDQSPWLLDVPHQATVKGAAWLVYFCDVQVCSLSKRHRWGRLAEHESQLFTWITQAHTARRRLLRHKLGSGVAVSWNEEFIFWIYFYWLLWRPGINFAEKLLEGNQLLGQSPKSIAYSFIPTKTRPVIRKCFVWVRASRVFSWLLGLSRLLYINQVREIGLRTISWQTGLARHFFQPYSVQYRIALRDLSTCLLVIELKLSVSNICL